MTRIGQAALHMLCGMTVAIATVVPPAAAYGATGLADVSQVTGQQHTTIMAAEATATAVPAAIATGGVAAWGSNARGQLGNGSTTDSTTPVQVAGLSGATAVASRKLVAYALRADGTVWAWGSNAYGQLGSTTSTSSATPVQVAGLSGVTAIATSGYTGFALRGDGTVWAWGSNYYGELGNGTTTNSATPVRVGTLSGITAITATCGGAMGLRSDGTVWSWGHNTNGGFCAGGDDGLIPPGGPTTPAQVAGLSGVTSIAGGVEAAYAVRADRTLWAWGAGAYGALGNGSTTTSATPVQVAALAGVIAVAAGSDTGYAVRDNGTAWAWGYNRFGQLGTGSTTNSTTPVQISGLSGVTSIGAGDTNGYAVRGDGTAWAWGTNYYGQLGNGTTTGSTTPVQVAALTGAIAVAAGDSSGYALSGGSIPTAGTVPTRQLSGHDPCLPCGTGEAAAGTGGDPVDTAAGGFFESFTDLSITGRGLGAIWARSYSSVMAGDDGPLGFGWHTGYGAHLMIDKATGNVTVSQENGAEVVFTNTAGTYAAPARVQATLSKNADGSFTFVRQRTQTLRFDAAGVLLSMADRNGETTTLGYSGGKLATVTEPGGRALTVTYTGSHITKVTDPAGHGVGYGFDTAGNLTTVTAPDAAVTTFGYDSAHRLTTVLDPQQQTASTKRPLTNVYDGQGRVATQTDQLGRVTTFAFSGDPFTSAGGTTVVTDPGGHERADVYQYGLRVGLVRGFATTAAVTTTFTYDPVTLGVTSTTSTTAGDPNTHATTATYDPQGHPLTQTDGLGRVTETSYNAFGDPLTATRPNPSTVGPARITTTYTYDAKGNLLSMTRPWYTSATAFTEQKVTYLRTTTAHPGDVTGIVDALGNTTARVYDDAGNLKGVSTPQGRTTTSTFDAMGWVRTTTTAGGHQAGADPARFTTTFDYDAVGRLRSTSVAAPDGPLVTTQSYDLDGRLRTRTDPLGKVTSYDYDAAGQLSKLTRPGGSNQQTTYWPDGEVKTQVDGRGKTTTYAEDPLGRVGSVTDPLARTTAYTYDAADAVLTVTDPQNQLTTNTYDAAGALASTSYSDVATAPVKRTYNAAGLLATMADGTGTTTFTYDSMGHLTREVTPTGTVGYGYNLRDQVTKLTYPNGSTVTRTFDPDGPMHSVTDWLGGTTTFGYDPTGALSTVAAPNGVTTTTGHDDPGRVTSTTITKGTDTLGALGYGLDKANQILTETSSSLGASRTFGYDDLGRVTAENAAVYGYDDADNLTTNAGRAQTYDNASQLATAAGTPGTTFTFDKRGNRTTTVVTGTPTTTYGYDQANRLTSYTSGTTTATYAYNGDGLRVSKTVAGTASTFGYDTAEGLPLILSDGSNSFVYGPNGLPLEQIASGTATYLHTDQLGSVRLLTDTAGTTVGTASYTAYGTRTLSGTSTTPLGLAGQYTDAESGLIYLRARFYDPTTGGFLTVDPAVAHTRSPYTYAGDNPITGSDPTGLHCWSVHCLLNDTAKITTMIQIGADTVALLTGAVGLEPVAGLALSVSELAGTINVAATCADVLTGAKGRATLGDCVANGAITLGTFGFGKLVAQPAERMVGGKVVQEYTRDQRAAAAGGNLFGDLLGAARGWKYQSDFRGVCDESPKWEPAH